MKNKTRQEYIDDINTWSLQNPTRVFDDDFEEQRQYISDETWDQIYKQNNIQIGDNKWKKLPSFVKSKLFKQSINNAQNNAGKTILDAGKVASSIMFPILGTGLAASDFIVSEALPNVSEEQKRDARIGAVMEAIPFAGKYTGKGAKYLFNKQIKPRLVANKMNKVFNKGMINKQDIPLNLGWAPKQTILVVHKSNSVEPLVLLNPKRWDIINENAPINGIWFQGKQGIPRTEITNPGKGIKSLKARQLFANRPYTIKGDLTLKKPMQTVGEVPNRSVVERFSDLQGADGIIFNNVYDNGYNHNQVIFSQILPDKYTTKFNSNIPTTRLYRTQGSDLEFNAGNAANGELQRPLAGMWFTDQPDKIPWYAHNALRGKNPAQNIELQYVDVPTYELNKFKASNNKLVQGMDYEPEDYIIPFNFKRNIIPLKVDKNYFNLKNNIKNEINKLTKN